MWASFGSLSVVPWILFAQSSWNMDAVPIITAPQPSIQATVEVRDRAGVFGSDAERRARGCPHLAQPFVAWNGGARTCAGAHFERRIDRLVECRSVA